MKRLFTTTSLSMLIFLIVNGQESHQKQIDNLNAKIAKDPKNPSLYFTRGDIYDELNDFANSNKDFEKVLELYQSQPDEQYAEETAESCYRLADDYFFRISDSKSAMKYINAGLAASPGFKKLELLQAIVLAANPGKHDEAIEKYNALAKKYPDDLKVRFHYARFLDETDPIGAATQYEKIVEEDPVNKEALLNLGIIYYNELVRGNGGDSYATKAINYFERAHQETPGDRELTNILQAVHDEIDAQTTDKKTKIPF